jgi:hypothetical protein
MVWLLFTSLCPDCIVADLGSTFKLGCKLDECSSNFYWGLKAADYGSFLSIFGNF